jgi:hypothetical protein
MVVAATTLMLLASNTITGSVFAAKTSKSHHSGKSSGKTSSTGTGNSSSSISATDSTNNNTPSTISNANPNMDNLLACESAAGHGSGQLTKAEVMNCYLQFSRGSASSLSIIGNANNSPGNAGSGSASGSTSTTHHAGSSTTHTNSHHHSATNPSGLRGSTTSSGWFLRTSTFAIVEFISFSFSFLND